MGERNSYRPSRRKLVRDLAAVGTVSAVGGAVGAAATTTTTTTTKTRATSTTKPATTPSLSVDDVAAANRVLGRNYNPAEAEMMAAGLKGKRDVITRIRGQAVAYNVPPAVSFDARLPGETYPTGPSTFVTSAADVPSYSGDVASLAFATVADLSRLIHAKRVTSVELTTMYLARLKDVGLRLNCVITLTEELALAQAKRADEELATGKSRGPLHGIPWGAKDLLATKGYPTTWGVEVFKDRVFDHDATVVRKLDETGAVLCAKLSLGELCMGDVWWKGMTRCPWDPKSGSSGSSAGPCAAVAAGLVPFAIGSETLGSIVSPCIVNGTTGLRPTYGRVSRFGAMSLSNTMDKLGPIARSVEDCAMVLAAIHGPDAQDATAVAGIPFAWNPRGIDLKGLRVGIDPNAFHFDGEPYTKNPELKDVYRDALARLRGLVGRDFMPISLPDTKDYVGLASLVIACEASSNFSDLLTSGDIRKLKQQDEGSWPNTFRVGSTIPAADYLRGMQVRTQLMRAMRDAMRDVDLYVTVPYSGPTISYTNLTGQPSVVCRAGLVKGRPKLIELIGRPFAETEILSLAHAFEREAAYAKVWPDTTKIPAPS